jgi:nucleoside-diphosphate-sugar epimerase
MRDPNCIVVTGASGAVGSYLIRDIARRGGAPVVALLRNEASLRRLLHACGPEIMERVRPVFADITREADVATAAADIGVHDHALVVHCAAEVSWTKPERLTAPVNVEGTRHCAELALQVSRGPPSFVFLSTAFCAEGVQPRNTYEATKLAAERLLTDVYSARLHLAILRCSLIVGASTDGWIVRFNGIYPLIRILALAEVPCLVAEPGYRLDTIPVDMVAEEIRASAEASRAGAGVLRSVVASGRSAMPIGEFVGRAVARIDRFRVRQDLPSLPPISILSERRYRFLMAASKSWDLGRRFAKVEDLSEVMAGYIDHGASGRAICPSFVGRDAAPEPADYIDRVVDHWVLRNHERIIAARPPTWLSVAE